FGRLESARGFQRHLGRNHHRLTRTPCSWQGARRPRFLPMQRLPANDLRQTVLTLAIPRDQLPGVGYAMRALLPAEMYDPDFQGQYLQTTYFDTRDGTLRKARRRKARYLTIRIRCYAPTQPPGRNYPEGLYTLSLKTEAGKYRTAISAPL